MEITFRKPNIFIGLMLGDTIASCVVDGKKYGAIAFGKWNALRDLAYVLIKKYLVQTHREEIK